MLANIYFNINTNSYFVFQHYINLVVNFGMDFTMKFDWISDVNQTTINGILNINETLKNATDEQAVDEKFPFV